MSHGNDVPPPDLGIGLLLVGAAAAVFAKRRALIDFYERQWIRMGREDLRRAHQWASFNVWTWIAVFGAAGIAALVAWLQRTL